MLAIDASTPVYVFTNTTAASLTTASFTPPVGSLLVVMHANAGSTGLWTVPTNTGGTVSWAAAAKITETGNGAAAAVWLGTVTSSASMTVTAHHVASPQDWGIGVAVVTGAAATQNGATAVATAAAAAPSATIASLVGGNSLVVGSIANFSSATVGTPGSNQTLTFNGHSFSNSNGTSGSSYWAQYDTRLSLNPGASDTINDSAPSVAYSMVAVEIVPAVVLTSIERPPLGLWIP